MKQSKKYRRALRKRNTRKKQKIRRTRKRYQKRKRVTRKKKGGWFGYEEDNNKSSLGHIDSGVVVHGRPFDPDEQRLKRIGFKGPAQGREGAKLTHYDIEQSNREAALLRHKKELEREERLKTLDFQNRERVRNANRGYFTNLSLKGIRGEPRTWNDWVPFSLGYNVIT